MLPQRLHVYQNHSFDSTRWDGYRPRDADVVITTSFRSGTTWTQEIVRQLICLAQPDAGLRQAPLMEISPWLDNRVRPLESVMGPLEAQRHRRFLKTHLPLDGLPYFPQVRYIVVGRDVRDAFMSFYNFYGNFSDAALAAMNETPGRVGPPLPLCPTDIHECWRNFITRGWFEWESEGYPFWGNMHHTQSWWNSRQLENLLFVHYNDLSADLPSELKRIAHFLEIPLTDGAVAAILPALSLEAMRRNADQTMPAPQWAWKQGAQTFFFQGTNGRWRDLLSHEEVAMYEATAARVLSPDCRRWLEGGRAAWSPVSSVAMRSTTA